jgi:hypothetical protein
MDGSKYESKLVETPYKYEVQIGVETRKSALRAGGHFSSRLGKFEVGTRKNP